LDEQPYRLADLASAVRTWRSQGERVALCHGCFDLLHCGHVRHLEEAKTIADRLVVTVTPDRYVDKGLGRPVFPAEQRLYLLSSLRAVDGVAVNEWPTAVETIRAIQPDVFVKGVDYVGADGAEFSAEKEAAAALGVDIYFTTASKMSTTEILEKILAETVTQQIVW